MDLQTNEYRKKLELMVSEKYGCDSKLEGLEGIELIEKRDFQKDSMKGFNCFVYFFGLGNNIPFDLETYSFWSPTKGYSEVEIPERKDMVLYIDTKLEKEPSHIGFYEGENKVRSKWAFGNIYMHELNLVPECYGDTIKFFKKDN